MNAIVVGGGVGGLTAATRLAILGHDVVLLEARSEVGGLASGLDAGGLRFDGGPYILLDRPGLEWALEKIAVDAAALELQPIPNLYEVQTDGGRPLRISLDLHRTKEEIEQRWNGAGREYGRFVSDMDALRRKLAPLLMLPEPNLVDLARRGALGAAPFLLRSLQGVMKQRRFPAEVRNAIAIWTHIAGQSLDAAASVMAFVPALIHNVGAFVPRDGMRAIPSVLRKHAEASGVQIRCGTKAKRFHTRNGRVIGVEVEHGDLIECSAVISNVHGVGTYENLLQGTPDSVRRRLRRLPLQSPGLCAYIAARGRAPGSYLRFMLDASGATLAVSRGSTEGADDEFPMRLIKPMDHRRAEQIGEGGQAHELRTMLERDWWKQGLVDFRVAAQRTSQQWGREMHLYRDSMNPAMTRTLLLRGRMRHRSPWIEGLYLAGSSTHPGQWVSFCAISGVLAAECAAADFARR